MKNLSLRLIIAASIITNSMCYSDNQEHNLNALNEEQLHAFFERYGIRPQAEKTPTSPDTIEHQPVIFKGRQRIFWRKRIYFGRDAEGKPCYGSINQHEQNNPDFGNVEIVLFHEKAPYKLRFQDSFEKVGTWNDKKAENKLVSATARSGGLWCPEQNVFIGGTRDICMCDRYAEYIKQPEHISKLSKI